MARFRSSLGARVLLHRIAFGALGTFHEKASCCQGQPRCPPVSWRCAQVILRSRWERFAVPGCIGSTSGGRLPAPDRLSPSHLPRTALDFLQHQNKGHRTWRCLTLPLAPIPWRVGAHSSRTSHASPGNGTPGDFRLPSRRGGVSIEKSSGHIPTGILTVGQTL